MVTRDADVVGINVTLQLPRKEADETARAVAFARRLGARIEAENPGFGVRMTGMVMLNNAFQESAMNDMATLTPLMYVVIILVMAVPTITSRQPGHFTSDPPLGRKPAGVHPWGGAQTWPYAMAAHWRSRLRIGHGKGVGEQETEPGTLARYGVLDGHDRPCHSAPIVPPLRLAARTLRGLLRIGRARVCARPPSASRGDSRLAE